MTVINRSNIIRWTDATRKRHENLQRALYYIASRPFTSVAELTEHMGWEARSSGRVTLLTLMHDKLVEYSHDLPKLRGSGIPVYKATPDALKRAAELYPVTRPEDTAGEIQIRQFVPSGIPSNQLPQRLSVQRDPLVAFIHGMGRAPSLNFRDSMEA